MTAKLIRRARRILTATQSRPADSDVQSTFDHDQLGNAFRVALVSNQPLYFEPYVEALANSLGALGATVATYSDLNSLADSEAVILVGLHCFPPADVERLRRHRLVVGVQTEQLATIRQGAPQFGAKRLAKVQETVRHVDAVFDWSRENCHYLMTIHPVVEAVPYGFIEAWSGVENPDAASAAIRFDLGFVGSIDALSGRRRRILDELQSLFSVHPTSINVWRDDKMAVIAQCRIMLNLHVEASGVFESPRFFDVLGNGRALVSEVVCDPWPFKAGVDFLETTVLNLAATVERLLADSELRERVAAAGMATARAHGLDVAASIMMRRLIIAHQQRSVRA